MHCDDIKNRKPQDVKPLNGARKQSFQALLATLAGGARAGGPPLAGDAQRAETGGGVCLGPRA